MAALGLGYGAGTRRMVPEAASSVEPDWMHTPIILRKLTLAQADGDQSNSDIAPSAIEKYVAIYRDMQQNRSLTVAQAAAKQGLSVAAFRDLEQKIERDESARRHVRSELQA
ncbi:MAG TPA: hypothetical protein VHY56_07800, partial [Candidatus Binataceae bacterium]|nr:hypothetical protein [Candidatus Binataceae bacterium]